MLVSELIETLTQANPDATVVIRTPNYMHYNITVKTGDRREVIVETF